MTELVIKTIAQNTKSGNYRLVVLDNGSDGKTPEMLQQLHDAGLIDELILIKTNLGLEAARNLLLKNSTQSDYFICVDNDCLPPMMIASEAEGGAIDWTERLLELMQKYEDYGAISCRTQVMIGTGNIFEEADNNGDELVDFPHPGGSLRIMNTKAVHQVGGWDREAEGRGQEERYIGAKLHEAGYRTAFAVRVACLHLFGTRGEMGTDRWGYQKELRPEDTGHSDISHPALTNGDDIEEIKKYTGERLAYDYLNN